MDNLLYHVKEVGILTIICDYVCDKKLDTYVNNLKLLKYLWEQYTAQAISEEKFKKNFTKLISNINEYRKYRSEYKNRGGSYPQKNTTPIPKLPYQVETHPTREFRDLRPGELAGPTIFDASDVSGMFDIFILHTPPYGNRLYGDETFPFFGGGYTPPNTTWWRNFYNGLNGMMSLIRIEDQIFTWDQKLWKKNCKKFNINYNYCFYHQYYDDLLEREREKEKYQRNRYRYKNEKKHKKINNRSKYFNKKKNFFKYKKPSKHY